MMLTQVSVYLNLKRKFIYCAKEADLIREPDPENRRGGALQVKRVQNILAPKGACH